MIDIPYWRGCLIGTFIGLCLGMYLTSQLFAEKLPNNPNYVEKMQDRLK